MNKIITILIDVLMKSAFHVMDGCTWLNCIYRPKFSIIKDLHSSFQESLLTEYETNINQISILFDGHTTESTKGPGHKRRENFFCIS